MENASKALVIAGAILVAILLIGFGVMLINSGQGVIDTGIGSMSDQEKQVFNTKFTQYSGSQSGSSVKALIQAVITSNANNQNNIKVKVTHGSNKNKESSADLSTISNAITNGKNYTVSITYGDNGLVSLITIT